MIGPAILGIDGGGTSTIAWLANRDGLVLGKGRAGPSNAKAVGDEAARSALEHAIASAHADAGTPVAPVDVACFGLAGFDRPEDRTLLEQWNGSERWARALVLANDGELVVAAGTPEGWGVGVIAGTGSIAVGRAHDGRIARAGGWGHLIGDEGSAFDVARAALRLVARRADGRAWGPRPEHDLLTERLCEAMQIAGPAELVGRIYSADFDRTRIAALAPVVVAVAAEDPEVEAEILQPAGEALAQMAVAVAKSLALVESDDDGKLPLALAGGFLLAAPSVTSALLHRLEEDGYPATATHVAEPVRGAIRLAERALDT